MIPSDNNNTKTSEASSSSTTTSWSRFKDPRIVRVSRALGGKDRHSKVCTVRGLRDRRVRLSVPTAIQLYDLQDRLGLNQPSKVVDWLLNAAKDDIDELPPLQFPQGLSFTQNHDLFASQSAKQGLRPDSSSFFGKAKDVVSDEISEERQFHLQSLMNSGGNVNYHNSSFVRWDPSSLSLSQLPPRINEDWHNLNLSHGFNPVLVYQPGGMSSTTQSYLPSHQFDNSKQPNNFQSFHLLNSSFGVSTANLLPSSQNENEQNKGDEFHQH